MIPATEALRQLREGNSRFVDGRSNRDVSRTSETRAGLVAGQAPFAIILGCSDSRVPAEIVFDQWLGDLFVIRVAGNIVAPSQVGSVEFAATRFGTKLVVVLGHSQCGAIQATIEELTRPTETRSDNMRAIVDRIKPSVETLIESGLGENRENLVHHAVRANVRMAAGQLRCGSAIVERMIRDEGLIVVGAEYSLETGKVDFFDGAPSGESD